MIPIIYLLKDEEAYVAPLPYLVQLYNIWMVLYKKEAGLENEVIRMNGFRNILRVIAPMKRAGNLVRSLEIIDSWVTTSSE
jgi:hypothetical protein